jgi:hypothetical protein
VHLPSEELRDPVLEPFLALVGEGEVVRVGADPELLRVLRAGTQGAAHDSERRNAEQEAHE